MAREGFDVSGVRLRSDGSVELTDSELIDLERGFDQNVTVAGGAIQSYGATSAPNGGGCSNALCLRNQNGIACRNGIDCSNGQNGNSCTNDANCSDSINGPNCTNAYVSGCDGAQNSSGCDVHRDDE